MAYGGIFPTSYQGYYPQYPQQPMPQAGQGMSQTSNSIIWVQGEAGAKSYLVAPNTTVQLWDSEDQVIYLKSADASGMPSMKILDYKIRENTNPATNTPIVSENNTVNYVTKEELHDLEEKIQRKLDKLSDRSKREDIDE